MLIVKKFGGTSVDVYKRQVPMEASVAVSTIVSI